MKKKETEQNPEVEKILVEKINFLLAFSATLIPNKKKLEKMIKLKKEQSLIVPSIGTITEVFGLDYEVAFLLKANEKKVMLALLNLIEVLDKTEREWKEFEKKMVNIRRELNKIPKSLLDIT